MLIKSLLQNSAKIRPGPTSPFKLLTGLHPIRLPMNWRLHPSEFRCATLWLILEVGVEASNRD
jgi:hypothetical protein